MDEEIKDTTQKADNPAKKSAKKESKGEAQAILKNVWKYIWMFRGAIISIPVLVIAIKEAFRNAAVLPEKVGLNIQATGYFGMTVPRSTAVVVPLLVTIGCVLMATFTKRPLYPWLVSIFSLVLPWVIWAINNYPI